MSRKVTLLRGFLRQFDEVRRSVYVTVHEPVITVSKPDIVTYKTPSKARDPMVPVPMYGGRHVVTMIPGDGIGPEMMDHVQDIFQVAKVPVDFEVVTQLENETKRQHVENAILSIRRNGAGIKGNLLAVLDFDGFIAPNVELRAVLDLFVYITHYQSFPVPNSKFPAMDLIIIRQNTEGEFALLEHESVRGVVESLKIVTKYNTERLARFAFAYAEKNFRKKVTVIHNTPHMKLSDGLFLKTAKEVAKEYHFVAVEEMEIQKCWRWLVRKPDHFDVLLMPNLYGAVASNIICGMVGGPGLYSGVNYGSNLAIFEPATRHTGVDLVGKNVANPVAMLYASAQLLMYLEKSAHGRLIRDAIDHTLIQDKIMTPDVGGNNTTTDVVEGIKRFIIENIVSRRIRMF